MVAGIGCRAGVSGEQVEAAIAAAIAALSATEVVTAIATPATKAEEPGIQAAAANRRVPVLAISQAELEAANEETVTRSAHSLAAMNVHSVAEAAALAGARVRSSLQPSAEAGAVQANIKGSPKPARLMQPRVVVGPVTCALAGITTP
jgi:cobalt-precorrin 5A hydrolase